MNGREYITLNGDWDFAYSKQAPNMGNEGFPLYKDYETKMPVPGYWDDNKDYLKHTNFWSRDVDFNPDFRTIDSFPLGTGKPFDASLPYILGTGWYKKTFEAEADWGRNTVTLHIGGAVMETWVWLNGTLVGYHCGHLTPFEFNLNDALRPSKTNELLIAVSNIKANKTGCSIRGYKGRSAGITRSVCLSLSGTSRLKDCYVRTNIGRSQLIWEVSVENSFKEPLFIDWEIINPDNNQSIAQGSVAADYPVTQWITQTYDLEEWFDWQPCLYELRFVLRVKDKILDECKQVFGLRFIEANDRKLLLNGEPVFLRGLTDHAYFPMTCTVPTAFAFYMETLKKLKELGFNWIRFHTWTPPEECMNAADILGMMLQVEAPNGFEESDWLDILLTCRKHPSVVIYCCGNEVELSDEMLNSLEIMAGHCKRLCPDTLFNPMEGLRGLEYELDITAPGYIEEPYPYNAEKLRRLDGYSDVYAPHGSIFSYHSVKTDDKTMETRLSIYEKPCLMHEIGINDSYLNLDLEHRYESLRIGTDLYASARAYLKEMGVLQNAPVYYQNSCRWKNAMEKFAIENARRCEKISGYDLLGAIDCHWHRFGYAVGMMNEFYELKEGLSAEEVLRYNGRSVLLADVGTNRNLKSGQTLLLNMYVSLNEGKQAERGRLTWYFEDENGIIFSRNEKEILGITKGRIFALGVIEAETPILSNTARHLRLKTRLTGSTYDIDNVWDYWVFPDIALIETEQVIETNCLDKATLQFVEKGGRVLLLGAKPFPSLKTTFQIMSGGRTQGNNATVIYTHPALHSFPHDGYLDWQFYSMFEEAQTVVFNDLDIPFEPIIEVVSGYKIVRKQASLFELRVGNGGLLVCTLNIDKSDAGARYFHRCLVNYLNTAAFAPRTTVKPEYLQELIFGSPELSVDFSTDEGYDNGGHIK